MRLIHFFTLFLFIFCLLIEIDGMGNIIQPAKKSPPQHTSTPSISEEPKADEVANITPQLTLKDWDYNDNSHCGPMHWLPHLMCNKSLGECQSPIDIKVPKIATNFDTLDTSKPLLLTNYTKPLHGQLINTGWGIQFRPGPMEKRPEISGGSLDQPYSFVQYHFHWAQNDNEGSEHTINGVRYPAELHLVHEGVENSSKLAVIAIFLKLDNETENSENKKFVFSPKEMEALKQVVNYEQTAAIDSEHSLASKVPKIFCQGYATDHKLSPTVDDKLSPTLDDKLLPTLDDKLSVSSFVRYNGSLTTPPCSENVTWTVLTEPLLITKEQMSLLRSVNDWSGKVMEKNCRPVQHCSSCRQVQLYGIYVDGVCKM